jgi:predicted exporter
LHTISNEDVIKKDIWLALSISGVAFLLLFLLLFRDIRALMLLLMPVASVLVSIELSSILLNRLSYFIVGMGGVVAGIAIDYGIHVYMAVRSEGGRADAVKLVAKPVVIGALTTLSVFAAFFLSEVQGYRQLATFSISSIVLCLACALFLLPHVLSSRQEARSGRRSRPCDFQDISNGSGVILGGWVLVMTAAVTSASYLRFDSDIRQYDGSESHIFQAEERFFEVWGAEDQPAVFAVPGESLEAALRRNRLIYEQATALAGKGTLVSLSPFWPFRDERAANTERWRDFWRQGRESELRRLLQEQGAKYNFAYDAFSPFFDNLYADPGSDEEFESLGVVSRLRERFIQETENGYQAMSYFPDENRIVSQMSEISERHPGTFLVSRKTLSQALSRSIAAEIGYLSAIAALAIPILAGLLLRDARLTILALVPVITGTMAVLGMIPALGLFLNAPSVIALMVVVGLCIDYGIFMVYACHHDLRTGTRTAVTLSAVTTLIGTGVLLFARHPVLFSIGVTTVTGVLAGYLSSMLVVPSLYGRLLPRERRSR